VRLVCDRRFEGLKLVSAKNAFVTRQLHLSSPPTTTFHHHTLPHHLHLHSSFPLINFIHHLHSAPSLLEQPPSFHYTTSMWNSGKEPYQMNSGKELYQPLFPRKIVVSEAQLRDLGKSITYPLVQRKTNRLRKCQRQIQKVKALQELIKASGDWTNLKITRR
jgi:hypothetical protein